MFKGILFSSYRTLGKIVKKLLEESEHEYSAEEIEKLLHVKPNDPLLELIRKKAVHNEKVSGIYVYFSNNHTI
ncbi:MAG: hypothetical protein HQ521_02685 [Bacteroidetes bacterium]|nr:hypothetical protein [Bacteroidota bacterium]